MNAEEKHITALITEFKVWLEINRSEFRTSLRKYSALRRYTLILPIGLLMLSGNGIYTDQNLFGLNIVIAIIGLALIGLSRRISEKYSGILKYSELASATSERENPWLKNLDKIVGENTELLKVPPVSKAVRLSKKAKLDLFDFYSGLLVITDSAVVCHP